MSRISLKKGWERLFGKKGWSRFRQIVGKNTCGRRFLVFTLSERDGSATGRHDHPPDGLHLGERGIRDIGVEIVSPSPTVMVVIAAIGSAVVALSLARGSPDDAPRGQGRDQAEMTRAIPIVKARMRSLQRDRARKRMMQAVPQATLVIAKTRPTKRDSRCATCAARMRPRSSWPRARTSLH